MAYDEGLAERLREQFDDEKGVVEKKMFGGLCFMLRGNMCCGIVGDELMLRVGPERHAEVLARKNARPMNFTGRAMKGFVFVGVEGFESDQELATWVDTAREFVLELPAK